MAETPKKPQQAAKPSAPGVTGSPRRRAAHKLREERQQRMVLLITGATILVALLIIVGGVLYDQLWLPGRPVARVGESTLTRGKYWEERRLGYAREIIQNFQLLSLLAGNPQFTQQFQGQSPTINRQVVAIRRAELDDALIDQWQTRELTAQGANAEGVSVSEDEVAQTLTTELGPVFLPEPGSAELPAEGEPGTVADPAAEAGLDLTPAPPVPTAEGAPAAVPDSALLPTVEPTPASSPTPQPTLLPAAANAQLDQIVDEIYRRFELELAAVGDDPNLSKADFRAALLAQYREQALATRIQEQLVAEDDFSFSEEPARVSARQVLIAVALPPDADQAAQEAAFAAAQPAAAAVAAELQAGADFATLAAAQSDDPGSREQGGDLGFFDPQGQAQNGATYPPALVQAAFALDPGTISAPIRTEFGWHVIEVTERDIPDRASQLREARSAAFTTWLDQQRELLAVARFPEPTPSPTLQPTEPVPTAVPTFLPGPPTAQPVETPLPLPTP